MSVTPIRKPNAGIVKAVIAPKPLPNAAQIEAQLRDAIQSVGLRPPPHVIADGKIHHFHCNDQKRPKGWYIVFIHATHVAGSFGCWNPSGKWNWRYAED